MTTLIWFRKDLRLTDNPALAHALESGAAVIPVFLFAPGEEAPWAPGAASRWWLHHSLVGLAAELAARGSRLTVRTTDDSLAALLGLARECGASRVVWNRRYEPAIIARDRRIKAELSAAGLDTGSHNSALLYEPWTVATKTGGPFQVFSPFWRHCRSLTDPAPPTPAPARIPAPREWPPTLQIGDLGLEPKHNWAAGLQEAWVPGSVAAHAALERFLADGLGAYGSRRNEPGIRGTSRLSPHLHFGEIGPREVWHAAWRAARNEGREAGWRDSQFLAELGWREFGYHLLYHFPHTPDAPLRENYANFPWKRADAATAAWTRGATGYPLVDAGLRELWHTGWMHNRVRMIVASFLVKDLLVNWTVGAHWFWDTLVDADLASNTLGWQWVAGCGADAAPFFRIFNPSSQGTKFDNEGTYVRRWVPELARLPDDWIHRPWAAPDAVRAAAGVILGEHYPWPLVDHDIARREALQALAAAKAP